jgi:hypothetical protein
MNHQNLQEASQAATKEQLKTLEIDYGQTPELKHFTQ